jgi:DNA-binding protein HU-beta
MAAPDDDTIPADIVPQFTLHSHSSKLRQEGQGEVMAGKADIVDVLANSFEGLTKKQAGEVFDAIFDHIGKNLATGERVQIAGFGTFTVSERAARQGRNPKTKEAITIAASKNVRFKVGKQLKDSL